MGQIHNADLQEIFELIEENEFSTKSSGSGGLLVHEWIEPAGGAEKVLDVFVDLFPNSDLFCLWNDAPKRYSTITVKESWLAKTPLRKRKSLALPLLSTLWRQVSLPDYNWALISSHLFSHHVASNKALADTPTFVYAHTPARYIWEPSLDDRANGLLAKSISPYLRQIDRRMAQQPQKIAANSNFVRSRIEATWNRESDVIYPPVDVQRISERHVWGESLSAEERHTLSTLPAEFILGASRLVPYKRLDAVIKMGIATKTPVVIAGDGPDMDRLRSLALGSPSPVVFLGQVTDPMLFELYSRTIAYIFPPIEDFGIMPVEAMAAGSPVIAGMVGGASETVVHGRTGSLVDFGSSHEMRLALDAAASVSRSACIERAWTFDTNVFTKKIVSWLASGGIDIFSSIDSEMRQ